MWSGVIVAFYVIPHVINHTFGLISYNVMEGMRLGMKAIWRPPIDELVLLLAFLTHFLLSLFALYRRSSLRVPLWETFQMILIHVIGTAIAGQIIGFDTTY
jgi:adenylate cyclase